MEIILILTGVLITVVSNLLLPSYKLLPRKAITSSKQKRLINANTDSMTTFHDIRQYAYQLGKEYSNTYPQNIRKEIALLVQSHIDKKYQNEQSYEFIENMLSSKHSNNSQNFSSRLIHRLDERTMPYYQKHTIKNKHAKKIEEAWFKVSYEVIDYADIVKTMLSHVSTENIITSITDKSVKKFGSTVHHEINDENEFKLLTSFLEGVQDNMKAYVQKTIEYEQNKIKAFKQLEQKQLVSLESYDDSDSNVLNRLMIEQKNNKN